MEPGNVNGRVVITGASGFLGGHLHTSLSARGRDVLALTRRPIKGLTTIATYDGTPSGDFLVHLAEEPDRGKVNQIGAAYLEESQRVIRILATRFGGNMIYASSGAVYGDKSDSPYSIHSPTVGSDFYSRAKLANEEVVLGAGGIVVRLSNLYGPGMSTNNVMSDILRQIPGPGSLQVRDASPIRDFLHVSDAATAITMLLECNFSGIINVGSGVGISIHSLARLALNVSGEADRPVESVAQASVRSINVLDIAETGRVISWAPKMSLQEYFVKFFQAKTEADQ